MGIEGEGPDEPEVTEPGELAEPMELDELGSAPAAAPARGPRSDRRRAAAALVAALAVAVSSLPVLNRSDRPGEERLDASGASDLESSSTERGRLIGETPPPPDPTAPTPGETAPTVTVVLPGGLVIPLSSYVPAFFDDGASAEDLQASRPPVFGGTTTTAAGPGGSATRSPDGSRRPAVGTTVPSTGTTGSTSSTTRPSGTTSSSTSTTAKPTTTTATTARPTTTTAKPTTTTATTARPTTTTAKPTTTTARPTTTTTPPTTTTAPSPPPTLPGQRCTNQVPPGYLDEAHLQLIFDGQSLSLVPDWRHSWPTKVTTRRFPARWQRGAVKVVARGGTTYGQRASDARTRVDSFIANPTASDVRQSALFDDGGETDLMQGATAQQLFDRATAYHRARHDAGYRIIIGLTIPPAGVYTAAEDKQRQLYNEGLRKYCWSAGIDVLVDVASFPELQDPHDPRYFDQSDGYAVHYTDAATDLVAEAVIRAFP